MTNNFKSKKRFIFIPIFGLAFVALVTWVVMLLWNAILPAVFIGVKELSYWQAGGLLILCRLLFGGFRGPSGGGRFKNGPSWGKKMMNLSDEERQKLKSEWQDRCGMKNEDNG